MLVSHFRIREQLAGLLLELSGLTSSLERREAGAVQRVIEFLRRAEQALVDNRLRQSAELAAVRADLAAVRLGESDGRLRVRERRCALEKIGPIGSALSAAVAPVEQRIESARLAARQLLQLVAASGAVRRDGQQDLTQMVERIWQLAREHDQLKPLALQISVALNRQDIPLLLAEEIDPDDFAA
jgi:hypothetical protein